MVRNYKKEYTNYQGSSKQKKRRASRNTARNRAVKAGSVHKGDSKDIHHKDYYLQHLMCAKEDCKFLLVNLLNYYD